VGDGELPQCGDHLFHSKLLIEAKQGVEHDDRQDSYGIFVVGHGKGHPCRDDEDNHHRRRHLFAGDSPRVPRAACVMNERTPNPKRLSDRAGR
jgi:hypothetical protein